METYTLFFKFHGLKFSELSFNFEKIDKELIAKLNSVFHTRCINFDSLMKRLCKKFSCRVCLLYNPQHEVVSVYLPSKKTDIGFNKLVKILQCSQS